MSDHLIPPLKYPQDMQNIYDVISRQIKNSNRLKEIWDDFNSNGVDCGPYESEEEPTPNPAFLGAKPKKKRVKTFCSFCKHVGRPKCVYKSHVVKDCEHLKAHICTNCNMSGHTPAYCPQEKKEKE